MIDIRGKSVEELKELNERGLVRRDHIPEYKAWKDMKNRCNNPNATGYRYWGARGITVCEAWQCDFWAWFRHISRRPEGNYVQDRIDNNDGYKPGNVHWVTHKVSNNNQRHDKFTKLTPEDAEQIRAARGGPLTQEALGEIFGVSKSQISATQLGKRHNPDGAFERPPKIRKAGGGRTGQIHPNAHLSDQQVAQALQWLQEGKSQAWIAEQFWVSQSQISNIALGKHRTDVSGPRPEKRTYTSHLTGDRGVRKYRNKWVAQLKVNRRMLYLGLFGSKSDAAIAVNYHIAYLGLDRPLNEIPEGEWAHD